MHLSYFTDDELKSIIMDSVINHRNPEHSHYVFNHETTSFLTYFGFLLKRPLHTEETEKLLSLYDEVILSQQYKKLKDRV